MVGLDSFTKYFFQVVAYNSKGDGPGSNVVGPLATPESGTVPVIIIIIIITTIIESLTVLIFSIVLFPVPQAPFSLDIHVANPEVTLAWKPPMKTNGIMVGYQVTVKKMPIGQVNIIDVNKNRTKQVFEALDLDANYQFALLAKNRVGFGPPLVVNFDLKTGKKNTFEIVFLNVLKFGVVRPQVYQPWLLYLLNFHEIKIIIIID